MVRPRRGELVETLRRRILRGLQIAALAPGDSLPSTRALAKELHVDARVVAAAYRTLATEGLVQLKPRSGAFVSSSFRVTKRSTGLAQDWISHVYAEGIARGVRVGDLARALNAALPSTRVRAVSIATTLDQTAGLCREIEEDFGVECTGILAETIANGAPLPRAVARAQLIVTTQADAPRIKRIAERQRSEFVCIALRPDLYDVEYALLRGQHGYLIVADPRFARIARDYLVSVGGSEHVDIVIAAQADLSTIPPDAPVYVTHAARETIGATRLPDGLLPSARMLSADCAREIVSALLRIAKR